MALLYKVEMTFLYNKHSQPLFQSVSELYEEYMSCYMLFAIQPIHEICALSDVWSLNKPRMTTYRLHSFLYFFAKQ